MRGPSLSRVGLILLAAGGSRRLGTPKQLLRGSAGQSLVRRAAQTALESACRPVVCVLGASPELVHTELDDLPLSIVINPDWQTGLASSLKVGLAALTADSQIAGGPIEAVMVMLCDQPKVTRALLDSLVAAHADTGHQIIACKYGGTRGVPALFGQTLFGPLASLTGDGGARRVIRGYAGPMTEIPFPEGLLDIDTAQDAEAMKRGFSSQAGAST